MKILKLNTKPRAGPFIIETGRTFSYIIFGPAGPLNCADQITCDTGKTSLAKSLVAELGKEGGKLGNVWISNLTQLHEKQNKLIQEGIFIMDEIFYG